jgi:hypothetical protein
MQQFLDMIMNVRSLDFWTSSIDLICKQLESTKFRKLTLFAPSCDEREVSTLLGPLEGANLCLWIKEPNKAVVSLHPPEGWNGPRFRNVELSTYSEVRTMGEVQKFSDFECCTVYTIVRTI